MVVPRQLRVALVVVCVLAGIFGAGLLVLGHTQAAFSASTESDGNAWSTGSVTLFDDDSDLASFTESGLSPGSSGSRCVAVSYSGDIASAVSLAIPTPSGSLGPLAPYLNLLVEEGYGGGFGSCDGFAPHAVSYSGTASALRSAANTWATGVGFANAPAAGPARVFRVTWTVRGLPRPRGVRQQLLRQPRRRHVRR